MKFPRLGFAPKVSGLNQKSIFCVDVTSTKEVQNQPGAFLLAWGAGVTRPAVDVKVPRIIHASVSAHTEESFGGDITSEQVPATVSATVVVDIARECTVATARHYVYLTTLNFEKRPHLLVQLLSTNLLRLVICERSLELVATPPQDEECCEVDVASPHVPR
ncbi:MAG TPA: hypothetical protein VJZ91_04350, partial [Blastocatellia bacterium]|nr:hypothetical protein [Blastocatellia bacterium]